MMPNPTTGTYGFPSDIAGDPVLHLAMPSPDTFTHAEERRLFYVALTRAPPALQRQPGHARHTGAGADYDLATSQIDAPHESKGPDR